MYVNLREHRYTRGKIDVTALPQPLQLIACGIWDGTSRDHVVRALQAPTPKKRRRVVSRLS